MHSTSAPSAHGGERSTPRREAYGLRTVSTSPAPSRRRQVCAKGERRTNANDKISLCSRSGPTTHTRVRSWIEARARSVSFPPPQSPVYLNSADRPAKVARGARSPRTNGRCVVQTFPVPFHIPGYARPRQQPNGRARTRSGEFHMFAGSAPRGPRSIELAHTKKEPGPSDQRQDDFLGPRGRAPELNEMNCKLGSPGIGLNRQRRELQKPRPMDALESLTGVWPGGRKLDETENTRQGARGNQFININALLDENQMGGLRFCEPTRELGVREYTCWPGRHLKS